MISSKKHPTIPSSKTTETTPETHDSPEVSANKWSRISGKTIFAA